MLIQFQGMIAEYERALIIGTDQARQGFTGPGPAPSTCWAAPRSAIATSDAAILRGPL